MTRDMLYRMIARYRELHPEEKKWLITTAFIVLQVAIWMILFQFLWFGDKTITDTPVYYDYAGRIFDGLVPYDNFASEYPPLAMLLFSLPMLFSGSDYSFFVFCFELEMMLFSCGIVALLSLISWRLWGDIQRTALTLGLYTLFVVSIGSIVEARFDIAVAFLILACLACFIFNWRMAAWMLIGAGLMTKVVPVILAPLFLIAHYRRGQIRELFTGPLVALAAAICIALPFLFLDAEGLAESFIYHVERPLQLESSWSMPLLLLNNFTGYEVNIYSSYGSHNVASSMSDTLALISGPVTLIFLLVVYAFYWRRGFDGEGGWSRITLIHFAVVVIAVFIVGGKVFSPQFLIWLLPLLPLSTSRSNPWPGALFWAVLVLTQYEFPYRYWELYVLNRGMLIEVTMRNILLAVLMLFMLLSKQGFKEEGAGRLSTS